MNLTTLVQKSKVFILASFCLSLTVLSTSCGNGGSEQNQVIPGVKGPFITLNEDQVLISMVFENLRVDGGIRFDIPKYKYSYLEISPDLQSNGTLMAVTVSLQDIFGGNLQTLDPLRLPGGRNLPGVATGALPAVAFSISNWNNMSFYLGPQVFGIFIPVKKLGIGSQILTFRHFSGSQRVGNLSIVGEDQNGENSGILLMLDISGSTKRMLQDQAKKYSYKYKKK